MGCSGESQPSSCAFRCVVKAVCQSLFVIPFPEDHLVVNLGVCLACNAEEEMTFWGVSDQLRREGGKQKEVMATRLGIVI